MYDDRTLGRVNTKTGSPAQSDGPLIDTQRLRESRDHILRRESSVHLREKCDQPCFVLFAVCLPELADHDISRRNVRVELTQRHFRTGHIGLEIFFHPVERFYVALCNMVRGEKIITAKAGPLHIYIHIIVVGSPDHKIYRHGKRECPLVIDHIPSIPDNYIIEYHIDIGDRKCPVIRCDDVPEDFPVFFCRDKCRIRRLQELVKISPDCQRKLVRRIKESIHLLLKGNSLQVFKCAGTFPCRAAIGNKFRPRIKLPKSRIALCKSVYMRSCPGIRGSLYDSSYSAFLRDVRSDHELGTAVIGIFRKNDHALPPRATTRNELEKSGKSPLSTSESKACVSSNRIILSRSKLARFVRSSPRLGR